MSDCGCRTRTGSSARIYRRQNQGSVSSRVNITDIAAQRKVSRLLLDLVGTQLCGEAPAWGPDDVSLVACAGMAWPALSRPDRTGGHAVCVSLVFFSSSVTVAGRETGDP